MKISIILGSTREGRKGETVAKWVFKNLKQKTKGEVEVELLDLRDYSLPYYEEPAPSSMITSYKHPEVKRWVEKVNQADAYIIVTPEYNHGYPAVLKNALDYPYHQWNNKPVGFVSYGGSANGARSVEQLRLVAIELQMAPIREGTHIPLMLKPFDEKGVMTNSLYDQKLEILFTQLLWWTNALKEARIKTFK